MSLLSRLKRLWELSGTKEPTPNTWKAEALDIQMVTKPEMIPPVVDTILDQGQTVAEAIQTVLERKPVGQATVVQDNPLNIFGHGPDKDTEGDIDF